jgi:hypothetical protein
MDDDDYYLSIRMKIRIFFEKIKGFYNDKIINKKCKCGEKLTRGLHCLDENHHYNMEILRRENNRDNKIDNLLK